MAKQVELKDGRILPALPTDRTDAILATGIRKEGSYPRTRYIAWWDHKECVREFDGANWEVYTRDVAPERVAA